jgi:hypothetical protein
MTYRLSFGVQKILWCSYKDFVTADLACNGIGCSDAGGLVGRELRT